MRIMMHGIRVDDHSSRGAEYLELRIGKMGANWAAEVMLFKEYNLVAEGVINLEAGLSFIPTPPPAAAPSSELLADLLHKLIDFKKDANGLYLPKVNEGDTVIVDKLNAPDIKVFDPTEQAYEKVPKVRMD